MNIKFFTLGCKVNQYETNAVKKYARSRGHHISEDYEVPDAVVINTCTVTSVSDKKCRNIVRRAKKENKNVIVAVVGCYSQVNPEKVFAMPEIDIVMGTCDRLSVIEKIENYSNVKINAVNNIQKVNEFEKMQADDFEERHRAFIKIEDGCENYCSYCIIPYARGKIRSKLMEDIVNEIKVIAQRGYKEIVITGIHLASYGKDFEYKYTLADVILECEKIKGIERIRLGSLEPTFITKEFLERIKNTSKLCPHFHLSLQSGSDATLCAMRRKYTSAEYKSACELIREYYSDAAVTTDIIVGFPGESEENFNESLAFAKEVKLADAHVFIYSRREGTSAALMPNQIPKNIAEQRSRKMIAAVKILKKEFMKSQIGKTKKILFEKICDDKINMEGHTENYIMVKCEYKSEYIGEIKEAELTGIDENDSKYMTGRII